MYNNTRFFKVSLCKPSYAINKEAEREQGKTETGRERKGMREEKGQGTTYWKRESKKEKGTKERG